jgi:TonB family protein
MARTALRSRLAALVLACSALAGARTHAAELDFPEVANASRITIDVLDALLKSGVALSGTVNATIRITDAGTEPVAYYGAPMADERAAQVVRQLTAALRFAPTADWLQRHPERLWSVFWMFQTNGCAPPIYDFPRDSTAIRVCLDVRDGRFEIGRTYVSFDLPPETIITDEIAQADAGETCFYPYNDRTAGIEGTTVLLVYVDTNGRAEPRMILQSAGSESLDEATKGCVRKQRFVTKAGTPLTKAGYARFRWDWRLD